MADRTDPLHWSMQIVTPDGKPTPEFMRQWNAQRTVNATGGGGGGATTFLGLTDTPATYAGQGLKVVRVNAGATKLEFGVVLGTMAQAAAADYTPTSGLGTMAFEDAANYTPTSGLATVALSGDYGDLINLPTLGTMAAEDAANYTPTSGLGTMAFEAAANYTPTSGLGALAFEDDAAGVPYDNTSSGLAATDVQAAIDEVAASITPDSAAYPAHIRLTPETGVQVPTANYTALTSIFATPYKGDAIALYDGAAWQIVQFTEKTISLSGLAANTNYDVFGYLASGTLAIDTPLAWSNSGAGTSVRATALALQNGVVVKSGDPTRRYLGSFRTTGTTGQTEWTPRPASASGGNHPKLYIWNMYNRVRVIARELETDANWTYNSATIRAYNASSNNRVSFILGLQDDNVEAAFNGAAFTQATTRIATGALGLNQSTTFSSPRFFIYSTSGGVQAGCHITYAPGPLLGFNFLQCLERADSAASVTFYGGAGVDQSLEVSLWM